MIGEIQLKICGITRVEDAVAAVEIGADYLGFILHPASPRHVTPAAYAAMAPLLPAAKKVGVVVAPTPEELARAVALGFDFIQLHFPNETSFFEAATWSDVVPPARLWLAPRVPPGKELDHAFLPFADTFLVDTFRADKFGGTGQTGDWPKFKSLQAAYPRKTWVLSGGLSPENLTAALAATGATVIDVNSGVESAPGVKDHAKLRALAEAVR
ncbi:MAG: phosphoribosylanthranilate isomerase [Opitutae bacterium]|nr:phosphoribosylanthranilate isomerase [Opitutae bacterium]